jgi:hypothetical protein
MANLDVHGHQVSFDESAREGVHHLINISYEQVEALLNKAVSNGSTTFEHDGSGYKIKWIEGSNYSVSKKY